MVINMKDIMKILKDKLQLVEKNDLQNLALVGPVKLPIRQGEFEANFKWYSWLSVDKGETKEEVVASLHNMNLAFGQQSSVLVYGDFENRDDALIRMHSICHTGDIFGSQRCDCGFQLHESMKMIVEHGCGAIFYLADHEGRGIGLFSKSLAYLLQEDEYDTVQANHALGFEDDTRSYEDAIKILEALRSKPVTLITNNPKKLAALKSHGMLLDGHVPLWGGLTETNAHYLQTKVQKSGHLGDVEKLNV
ncbi:GTP cyclohydrolase [Lysinibacillus sp. 2017]|uniref:GTP cyclohydrolase II n=1 Tax=unclassified Lysinibacillus TaxID=2636778 RepID=UPI000D528CAD|nr:MULTISPECIES: GTP cyclohydrolase II [unclassified Lysinibacillus]AWE07546.1 GTP cyclohydrolase [Lysinibacillus sp. 2017]TGN36709.1 GTP cyclohydrolase II [Lysinibacillus sp. S2017]